MRQYKTPNVSIYFRGHFFYIKKFGVLSFYLYNIDIFDINNILYFYLIFLIKIYV